MISTVKISLIFLLMATFLHSENLTNKYKQLMNTVSPKTQSEVHQGKPIDSHETKTDKNYRLIDQVKKIQALKQDTFESTTDFNSRINSAIKELKSKVKFFAQNGSKEYSAGTATMMNYDADKEVMQLKLKWDDDLKSIFSEIKDLKTVSLNIFKDAAKALFQTQKTHYFHIDIAYIDSKLIISRMTLNDKFIMLKLKQQIISTTVPTYSKVASSNNASTKTSSGHENNAKITLDSFLQRFYQAGEENPASKALPFYAYNVERYFSMRNVTKKDILKDKIRYYKKWVKRKYRLIGYEIVNSSNIDNGAILHTIRSTVRWEVTSAKGKVKKGTSTNTIKLYQDHSGLVVTSIK